MRILTHGATRVVILIGPYAFKLARIRLFFALSRLVNILFSGTAKEKLRSWQVTRAGNIPRFILGTIFTGVLANRREWQRATAADTFDLVPTVFTFCYLVNVQLRGDSTPPEIDISGHPVIRLSIHDPKIMRDLRPEQFCLLGKRLLLADYGNVNLTFIYKEK